MPSAFLLTVRFLDAVPEFHGRGDGSDPEWPPSPLRLFQALVCAAAGRWRDGQLADYAFPALRWLEQQREPAIVAPDVQPERTGFRMYVPNNAGDLVTGAWARGNEDAKFSSLNVEKDVLPTRMIGGDSIHYIWKLPEEVPEPVRGYLETIAACARSITHLGWGVDMVAANAKVVPPEATTLKGNIWRPMPSGGTPLRVPLEGTLKGLQERHGKFLNRLTGEAFSPVPPLSNFHTVGYFCPTVATDKPAAARPCVAFSILKPDAGGFKPYDTVRRFATVAGMVRHAAAVAAETSGWAQEKIAAFIQGHGDAKDGQATSDDRLMFLPLPSITPFKVESIRRVLVVGPPGSPHIARVRQLLGGAELTRKGAAEPEAMLSLIPLSDRTVAHYTKSARIWSTVTPVMLPGYDDPDGLRRKLKERDGKNAQEQKHLLDRLDRRILGLLRDAFTQAGWASDLIAQCTIEYRSVGYRAGVDLASKYVLPPVHFPRFHVRVTFPQAVAGPLAVGAGRYRGLGLFAAEET